MSSNMSRRTMLAVTAGGTALAALPLQAQSSTLYEIEIKNFKYNPATLDVRPGDRIRWTNQDSAPHDAKALDGDWTTVILQRGESAELTVTAEMSADYMCSVHPSMRASLSVVST